MSGAVAARTRLRSQHFGTSECLHAGRPTPPKESFHFSAPPSASRRSRLRASRDRGLMCLMDGRQREDVLPLAQTGLSRRTGIKARVRFRPCMRSRAALRRRPASFQSQPLSAERCISGLLSRSVSSSRRRRPPPTLSPPLSVCNGPGEEQEGREVNRGAERERQAGKESRN